MTSEYPNGKRGFASMDPATVREIARQGGRAAHRKGRRISGRLRKPRRPDRRAARSARSAWRIETAIRRRNSTDLLRKTVRIW